MNYKVCERFSFGSVSNDLTMALLYYFKSSLYSIRGTSIWRSPLYELRCLHTWILASKSL